MRELTVSLFVLVLGAGLLSDDAEAARLGGGRSLGAQRQITTPPKQAAPPTQQPTPQPSGGVVGSPPLPGSRRGWAWAGCSRREVSRKRSALSSWPSLPAPRCSPSCASCQDSRGPGRATPV